MTMASNAFGIQIDSASVARGVSRLFLRNQIMVQPEVSLRNNRRADLMGINAKGEIIIVEIKVSRADLLGDQKWPEYRDWCDRLFFAISTEMAPEIMPGEAGLIVADSWGADILRQAQAANLHASRRKAVTLAFARAAALRLHGLYDPMADSL